MPNKSSALQMVTREGGVPTAKRQTNVGNRAPVGFDPDSPTKFGLMGGLKGAIQGIGSLVKGKGLGDAGKAALGGLVGGSGLMKLGGKPCPGCKTMCPQCAGGRRKNSALDKHCF